MSDHDSFSPSGASRWLNCAAAHQRTVDLPEEESGPAAQWGTDSHAYAERSLRVGIPPEFLVPDDAPDKADELEKAECAAALVAYVDSLRGSGPIAVRVEEQVDPGSTIGVEGVRGYADVIVCTANTLEVIDLKTGRHIVEPDAPQLQLYLLGALNQYWRNRVDNPPFQELKCTVVQPRAPHTAGTVRSAIIPLEQLLQLENDMQHAVNAALGENPLAEPGAVQCRWCRVRGECPEAAAWNVHEIARSSGGDNRLDEFVTQILAENRQASLTHLEISTILGMKPTLLAWLDAVSREALERAKRGESLPGWKLVDKQGRPKWISPEDVTLTSIKRMRGIKLSDCVKTKLLSPLQVTAAASEKMRPRIEALWERPAAGQTLVVDSDPRSDKGAWLASVKTATEKLENKAE